MMGVLQNQGKERSMVGKGGSISPQVLLNVCMTRDTQYMYLLQMDPGIYFRSRGLPTNVIFKRQDVYS